MAMPAFLPVSDCEDSFSEAVLGFDMEAAVDVLVCPDWPLTVIVTIVGAPPEADEVITLS